MLSVFQYGNIQPFNIREFETGLILKDVFSLCGAYLGIVNYAQLCLVWS